MGRDHQKHVASFVDAKGSGLKKEVLLANTTDMLPQTPLDVYIAQKGKAHFNKNKLASLGATLVRNSADPLNHLITDRGKV